MIARLCIFALAAVWLNAQNLAPSDVNLWSKEKEAALGASLAREVRRQTWAVTDSAVNDYIARLGRQIAAEARGGDLDWEFAVVGDEVGGSTHEAVSIPGGHVFVPASLILGADSEAELAGMIAHSIAHIVERHSTRIASRQQAGNPSTIPLAFVAGVAGSDTGPSVPVEYLKVWRSYELDADRAAVTIMAAAGYDPAALLEYIRRTQRAGSKVFSALPQRGERIGALETAIANLPSRTGWWSSSEFNAIQDRVRAIAAPSAPSAPKQPPSLRRKDDQ